MIRSTFFGYGSRYVNLVQIDSNQNPSFWIEIYCLTDNLQIGFRIYKLVLTGFDPETLVRKHSNNLEIKLKEMFFFNFTRVKYMIPLRRKVSRNQTEFV